MAYPEPYFNNSFGRGMEGLINYVNVGLFEGWMIIIFLAVLWVIGVRVGSKSEWKMSNVIAYVSLTCLLLSWIASLFTVVNELAIYIFAILTATGVVWSLFEIGSR